MSTDTKVSRTRYFGLIYILGLPALMFAVAALVGFTPRGSLDTTITGVEDFDTCEDTCLVIYLAPWCSACKALRPTATALAAELIAEGIPVTFVVGNDSQENCEAYAEGLPGDVHLDPNTDFAEQTRVRSFPTFIVRRGQRTTKMQPGGVPDEAVMRQMLEL